jgi:hypothetical protein
VRPSAGASSQTEASPVRSCRHITWTWWLRATSLLWVALVPAVALAGPETLRWIQPSGGPGVIEFRVYKGPTPDDGEIVWTGLPVPDAAGIHSADVQIDEIDQGIPVYVWLTAANAAGESPASNANFFAPVCDPGLDADCDGIPDDGAAGDVPCVTGQTSSCDDNCPYAANPGQQDSGGIGTGPLPDGIGDECQCGDVNGDGRLTFSDAVIIFYATARPPGMTMARPELCDVGASAGCTFSDAVVVLYSTASPPGMTIGQQCEPAQPLLP